MPYKLKPPKDTSMDMPVVELKIAMLLAGVTQKEIAERVGVTRQAVSLVVNKQYVSHRIRVAIAESLGMDIKRIWPSSYLHGGPRKPGRPAHVMAG
jgi:transcriptional regulator with XRE-family HTH domain